MPDSILSALHWVSAIVGADRGTVNRFDDSYYLGQSDSVRERARERFLGSALLDYLWVGASERRNPTATFDEAYYLTSNPDVGVALRSSQYVCGYHHFLKNGEGEGRRGAAPGPCCVIDAGRAPAEGGPAAAAVASAIQRARPGWKVLVVAGWMLPVGSGLHPWIEWVKVAPTSSEASARVKAEDPDFLVRLGEPMVQTPEGAGMIVVAGRADAPHRPGLDSADPVLPLDLGATPTAAELDLAGERVAVAVETVAQFRFLRTRSRLVGGDPDATIGLGLSIAMPAADGARVVTIAVDLPPARDASKETLVLEADGDSLVIEASVGRSAQAVVRVGAAPTRIVVRPCKAGYRAASRIVLARIEAAPVDLVTAPIDTDAPRDALAVVDLNTDLARVKRELGRFLTKADAFVAERPAFEFGLPSVPRLDGLTIPRCLIVSTFDAERSWAGREVLDVAAWREYLEVRGFQVDFLELPLAMASDVGRMRKQDLSDQRFVVLTSPRTPELLTDGLERGAHTVRLYRGGASGGRTLEAHRRADDLACARAANRLILAGPGDAAYYRGGGIPPGQIDYVPEYLPSAYRRLPHPYPSRRRQVVLHIDSLAVLEDRIRGHRIAQGAIPVLLRDGWTVVVSASPRLRSRVEADLGLDEPHPSLTWCDPTLDLPAVLHTTRLVLAPAVNPVKLGGLTTAASILGFRVLVDGPAGRPGIGHLATLPRAMTVPGALDRLDADPGSLDMEAVRAEAFRSLDRVLGFRGAGWQEGRHGRSADI